MEAPLKLKYIRVQDKIFMFPESVGHNEMARRFPTEDVRTAGFVQVASDGNGGVVATAYGKSESLGLESDPTIDSELLRLVIR